MAHLAGQDWERSLVIARRIKDPWFACQALAWVARYAAEEEVERIAEESLAAGRLADDPYKVVAAAAWPVRALIERNRSHCLLKVIPDLLTRAERIDLFASRSEALFLLFQAVFPAGPAYSGLAFDALQRASEPMINWRQKRNLRDAILILWEDHRDLAEAVMARIDDKRLRRQIGSRIASGKRRLPRPFFWDTVAGASNSI